MTATTILLRDLCDFVPLKVNPQDCDDCGYVGLEHLASGSFERIGAGTASDVRSAKYAFEPGDVLYGRLRPYLDKAILAHEVGICTTELLVLRPKEGVNPRFLISVIHSPTFVQHAVSGTTGAQHPRTSWRHISAFELPLFDRDEQSKIAALMWRVNEGIAANETAASTGDDVKRSVMHALFTQGLREEPQKETEIGLIPASWDVVGFESVREWLQYGTSARCSYEATKFPVLRIPNVEPGHVNSQDIKFATLSAAEGDRYRLTNGDLIFIRSNGVVERLGACAVYAGEPEGALFASYLIRARLKLDRVNPYFVSHFLGSETGTNLIAGRATPAADGKYNLNTGTIDSLPLPLPPSLYEQGEIVRILDALDRSVDLHRRKRAILEELSKALLNELMTGQISVADLAAFELGLGAEVAA